VFLDRVVPFQQSEQIHKFLLNKGIRTELEIFEGEGHGFRRSENTEKVLNGTLKFFREAMNIDKAIPISHI
jgi:dipeptidyl aminopeptidase/acylaminoacyl peptidase